MSFELREKLARVARQIRSLRLWTGLAVCWLVWAIVGAAAHVFAATSGRTQPLGWIDLAVLALISAAACAILAIRSARDERAVARRIEACHPELHTLLLAAVEHAAPARSIRSLGFLQKAVICEAVAHGRRHNWTHAVGPWRLRGAKILQFLTLTLFVAVCVGLANRAGATSGFGASLFGNRQEATPQYEVAVDPGNFELERGSPLVVIAQFTGAMPPDATLVVAGGAEGAQTHEMSRSLDDPKFVGRLAAVNEDLSYHVGFADKSSETFRITVFDYPALVRADARLEFPKYTGLEPKVIEDVRHISAVKGAKLALDFRLNKPVAEATLAQAKGPTVSLERDPSDDKLYRTSWTLAKSGRYKLQLRDDEKRANRMPEEIVVSVTPNRPPQVKIERPARDVEVSPLEELQLKWKASDDYGVVRSGVSYSIGGAEPRDIELPPATDATSGKEQSLAHLIEFESLKAKPDELLSYFVWVEDIGPDGQPRRTSSDMYFAEARPFEQIFRQGEQPSESEQRQQQQQEQQQGASGNQQRAEELTKMQKEIINATWKLVRRESGTKPTAEFGKDTGLVKESQQSAIARANQMAESLEDAESRGHLQSAQSHMTEALNQLTTAEQEAEPGALRPALSPEQAAYQDLLKLRAREFQVVRNNRRQQQQRGQSASRSNSMQRQLNQLELSADENRYETQNRARAPEENQAQQQSRETLNKLRDLARRQEDMNDRLRELQSELEKAQTPQEREELERELKRLRDQQQEILRDTDEMIAQNDQSNNQQQSQDARQKMEDARSRVEQTSQALEQNQLSQAVTESARAGEQLKELRDDFRKQSANQFADDMTEMRRQARDLDARQQQLSQQLEQQEQSPGRSLRATGEAAETEEGLKEQQENLGNLLEQMRQTIEAAEEPEPILARQLYDTAREANQKRLEDRLDVARKLMDAGVRRQAGEAMKSADEGVNNLRRGVERAAESVLGDETESLRRAQSEIDQLAEELNREINERRGGSSQQAGAEQDGSQQANQLQEGEQRQLPNEGNPAAGRSGGDRELNQNDQPQEKASGRNGNNEERRNNSERANTRQGRGNQRGAENDNQAREPNQPNGQQQGGAGQPAGEGQQPPDANQNNGRNDNDGQDRNSGDQRERSSLRGNYDNNSNDNRPNQDGDNLQQVLERSFGPEGERGGRGGVRESGRGGPGNPNGPITGRDFRDWSERLRDVEDMLDDADLRSEAARIRDRAAEARTDYKKHSAEPDWGKLKVSIAEPLNELSRRIENEIRRHESPDALVPIDRDPVPPEFSEQVRRYYERLGSGE